MPAHIWYETVRPAQSAHRLGNGVERTHVDTFMRISQHHSTISTDPGGGMVMAVAIDGDHVPNGQFFTFDMVSVVWQTQCSVVAGQDQSALSCGTWQTGQSRQKPRSNFIQVTLDSCSRHFLA
jgi:hypothetical protein